MVTIFWLTHGLLFINNKVCWSSNTTLILSLSEDRGSLKKGGRGGRRRLYETAIRKGKARSKWACGLQKALLSLLLFILARIYKQRQQEHIWYDLLKFTFLFKVSRNMHQIIKQCTLFGLQTSTKSYSNDLESRDFFLNFHFEMPIW